MGKDYHTISDEELIGLYRSGDWEAREYLMERYQPLVLRLARLYYMIGGDTQDLLQEGNLGLIQAADRYDAKRSAGFRTFATTCITRKIQSAVTNSNAQKRNPLNQSISLDLPLEAAGQEESGSRAYLLDTMDTASPDPEQVMLDRERVQLIEKRIREELSGLEYEVYRMKLRHLDNEQISALTGRDRKAVENAGYRIRMKIDRILEELDSE